MSTWYTIIVHLFFYTSILVGADDRFNLLTSDKQPTYELLSLLDAFKVVHDGTVEDIVKQTQHHWLRKPGTERWEINAQQTTSQQLASMYYQDDNDYIDDLLASIGIVHAIYPTKRKYDYLLFNGGPAEYLRPRMKALRDVLTACTIERVVFLTGEVPLDTSQEPIKEQVQKLLIACNVDHACRKSKVTPQNEYALNFMAFIMQSKLPRGWHHNRISIITEEHPIIHRDAKPGVEFVKTPMQGSIRPNTASTFKLWLQSQPKPGSCLAISHQPFIGYQDAVAHNTLPHGFTVETIGKPAPVNVLVHLDTIARWLYVAHQQQS